MSEPLPMEREGAVRRLRAFVKRFDERNVARPGATPDAFFGFEGGIDAGGTEVRLSDIHAVLAELNAIKNPTPAHVESMALRYHHGFPMLSESIKDGIRSIVRQMHEEATLQGFYQMPEDSDTRGGSQA